MIRLRTFLVLAMTALLAACSGVSVWAPDDMVQRVRYSDQSAAYITLMTGYNVGNNKGSHSGLIINASERVLFDPAGTFVHKSYAERNDVIFGINPAVMDSYINFHTQPGFWAQTQTVYVSPQVAEDLLRRVKAHGAVASAMCSNSISGLLQDTPGFESIKGSWFPENLAREFADLPNVQTKRFDERGGEPKSFSVFVFAPGYRAQHPVP